MDLESQLKAFGHAQVLVVLKPKKTKRVGSRTALALPETAAMQEEAAEHAEAAVPALRRFAHADPREGNEARRDPTRRPRKHGRRARAFDAASARALFSESRRHAGNGRQEGPEGAARAQEGSRGGDRSAGVQPDFAARSLGPRRSAGGHFVGHHAAWRDVALGEGADRQRHPDRSPRHRRRRDASRADAIGRRLRRVRPDRRRGDGRRRRPPAIRAIPARMARTRPAS